MLVLSPLFERPYHLVRAELSVPGALQISWMGHLLPSRRKSGCTVVPVESGKSAPDNRSAALVKQVSGSDMDPIIHFHRERNPICFIFRANCRLSQIGLLNARISSLVSRTLAIVPSREHCAPQDTVCWRQILPDHPAFQVYRDRGVKGTLERSPIPGSLNRIPPHTILRRQKPKAPLPVPLLV